MAKKKHFVGLDIGTTKICSIIAEYSVEGQLNIIGLGTSSSEGLRKGVVVDVESTVESIGRAIDQAQNISGIEVDRVFAGIAGGHIKSINSKGVVPVTRADNEITDEEIERVISAARAISMPMDREVIHIIPQEYTIDGKGGIKDPLGMNGVRLEVEVHIVTAAVTSAQNIIKCIHRAGIEVEDIVLEPLASGFATLTPSEKKEGVILIDIGGGTTDYLVYSNGIVRHSGVLQIGGDHVTNDISVGLKIPVSRAEEIKKKYGCAYAHLVGKDEEFMLPGVLGRRSKNCGRRRLCEIIEPRMEEILGIVRNEIHEAGILPETISSIVVTGGASLLPGTQEMTLKVFEINARIGRPMDATGLVEVMESPIYATGVGLVQYGSQFRENGSGSRFRGRNLFAKTALRMKEWFGEYF